MTYFRELPDLEYQSPFSDKVSSRDYVRVKNLFRRVKLRDDLQNVFTLFNKYQVPEGARPDTVAEALYGSAEYDWVVLLSAGIVNVREQWPLSDRDVYRFAEKKYGIDKLNESKYFETIEVKDSSGRLILPKEKIVNQKIQIPRPSIDIQIIIGTQDFTINNELKFASGKLLYVFGSDTISTTNNYGTFTITENKNDYDWFYQFNISSVDLINFSENFGDAEDSISYLTQDGYRRSIKIKTRVTKLPYEEDEEYSYELSFETFANETSYITYYDEKLNKQVTQYDITRGITNYEYEVLKNNEKRNIFLLKPIYLQQYINDLRKIMYYEKSSQYVSKKLVRTENTQVTSP